MSAPPASAEAPRPVLRSVPQPDVLIEEDDVALSELLGTLKDSRRLIATVAAVALGCGLIYALAATPIYRVEAMVQVEAKNSFLEGFKDLSSALEGEIPSDAELEIIGSRSVGSEVVSKLHLDIVVKPRRFPLIGGYLARRFHGRGVAPAKFGLSSYAWGGEKLKFGQLDVEPELQMQRLTLVARDAGEYDLLGPGGELLVHGRSGELAKDSEGRLTVRVDELKARPGTRFYVTKNPLAEAVTSFLRKLKIEEKGKQSGIIHLSLEGDDRDEATAALDALTQSYVHQNIARTSEEARKTFRFISDQLPDLKARLEAAEVALNQRQSKEGRVNLGIETQALVNKSAEIEKSLTNLSLQRSELSERFTGAHPTLSAIAKQRAQLEQEKATIESQLKNLPSSELNLVRLTRDVQVNSELYLLLLNKAEELKVVESGTVGNVRIIDPASQVQILPVKPKKSLILALSLMGGLLLGVACALLKKVLHRGVDDPDLLERITGFPVYASIPHASAAGGRRRWRANGDRQILAQIDPGNLTVEALRSLRTSLQFALSDAKSNVVVIGGTRPEIGKSFIAVNLASLLASSGKRVVVVDADMRKGRLHGRFGAEHERAGGLSEVLSGTLEVEAAVRPSGQEGLSFISAGVVPPNPAELLLSDRFGLALKRLSEQFDLVILDTPPLLAVTDAVIVARHAGVTFLVLKSGVHPMGELRLALRRLAQNGIRTQGFVMNDVMRKPSTNLYGEYRYVYR